jgi:GntR family transcriptional regulator, transcriptional repressor for pyruvate dehydrogenase complex
VGVGDGRRIAGARAAVFAPVDSTGRAETVARRLTDAIRLGLLRDDEQLPSESDLAAGFGVAVVTVREALTQLRGEGLVRTRRGRGGGSFICAPGDAATGALRAQLVQLGLGEIRDLCDHYAAISGTCARLAAARADADDLGRLEQAARALSDADDEGSRRRAEGRFHLELAAAAQSPRLTREEIALQASAAALLWLPHVDEAAAHEAAGRHTELVAALAAGDEVRARDVAEAHAGDLFLRLRALHRDAIRTG